MPIALCWSYARPVKGSANGDGGVGFLYNFGFFDRAGAIPILYSGAIASLVASAVIGQGMEYLCRLRTNRKLLEVVTKKDRRAF